MALCYHSLCGRTHQHLEVFPKHPKFQTPMCNHHSGDGMVVKCPFGKLLLGLVWFGPDETLGREGMRDSPSMRKDRVNRTKRTGVGVHYEASTAPAACPGPLRPPGGAREGHVPSGWGSAWWCPWDRSDVLSPQSCACCLPSTYTAVTRCPRAILPPLPQVCVSCRLLHQAIADQPHFLKSLPPSPSGCPPQSSGLLP